MYLSNDLKISPCCVYTVLGSSPVGGTTNKAQITFFIEYHIKAA